MSSIFNFFPYERVNFNDSVSPLFHKNTANRRIASSWFDISLGSFDRYDYVTLWILMFQTFSPLRSISCTNFFVVEYFCLRLKFHLARYSIHIRSTYMYTCIRYTHRRQKASCVKVRAINLSYNCVSIFIECNDVAKWKFNGAT